jgi:hypothetical protein
MIIIHEMNEVFYELFPNLKELRSQPELLLEAIAGYYSVGPFKASAKLLGGGLTSDCRFRDNQKSLRTI